MSKPVIQALENQVFLQFAALVLFSIILVPIITYLRGLTRRDDESTAGRIKDSRVLDAMYRPDCSPESWNSHSIRRNSPPCIWLLVYK